MKIAFRLLLFAVLCGFVQASVITFENLTIDDEYFVGDTFVSDGVQITGEEYFWLPTGSTVDGFTKVQSNGDAGGSDKEMWLNNINLSFDFGFVPIEGVSLQYGEYGGNVNLEINGDLHNVEDFSLLNGMNIGGVTVTVVDAGSKGALFAIGPVNSFSIGGQELAIDNVIASVIPEPMSLSLLALGGLLLRKRK